MTASLGPVLVDGEAVAAEDACISAFDLGFQRGYGCFEAMRAYGGTIFRLGPHLDRLARSAAMLFLRLPDRGDLEKWSCSVVRGDCIVKILVSAGFDVDDIGRGSRVIVYATPVGTVPPDIALQSRVAPWHSDGTLFELTGAKALSYGFNLAATLAARRAGFDDALLVGESGHVLEGPTFSVAWTRGDTMVTPGLDLGILESITRAAVIEAAQGAGFTVTEGAYAVGDLLAAEEAIVMSTTREVLPIVRVDDHRYSRGAAAARIASAFHRLVIKETANA